jgi:hypothetical protein
VRVRITRLPPPSYGDEGESLRIGNVYNLEASLASALLADDCAELFETLSEDEKQRVGGGSLWQAPDRDRRRNRAYSSFSNF